MTCHLPFKLVVCRANTSAMTVSLRAALATTAAARPKIRRNVFMRYDFEFAQFSQTSKPRESFSSAVVIGRILALPPERRSPTRQVLRIPRKRAGSEIGAPPLPPNRGQYQDAPVVIRRQINSFAPLRLCVKLSTVQARFLLGPAGSGKTFRCLAEIRAALRAAPDGPPLVLLAPKQATFQLECQLLADPEISGFTRLQILSFDRLAKFIFQKLTVAPPKLLSAEGRLMVLRALLLRHADELKLFSGSARRAGFAQELGTLLAELQQHQFTPAKLRVLAAENKLRRELRDKLHDLALLSEKYTDWLCEHELQDANSLLDFATSALRDGFNSKNSKLKIEGLWLDGFAEMTPQELALLAATVPLCERATLAFCLETEPTPAASWLSIWSAIGKTFQQCRTQLASLPGGGVELEILQRKPGTNRFAENSALAELEQNWSLPASSVFEISNLKSQISVTACANPEAEAVFAAREVLKFV